MKLSNNFDEEDTDNIINNIIGAKTEPNKSFQPSDEVQKVNYKSSGHFIPHYPHHTKGRRPNYEHGKWTPTAPSFVILELFRPP